MDSSSLAISWVLASISGYGMYGLHIAQQFLRRGGKNVILTNRPAVVELPLLQRIKLLPAFMLAEKLSAVLRDNPQETLNFRHPVLHGCSSDFQGFPGQNRVWGQPNVSCCAIEHLVFTDHGKTVANHYDTFIAISRWNEGFLKSLPLKGPVHLCHQGVDPTIFHPGPRTGLYGDRFVVFSGGKFEFRKGQDIVVAAFKKFREKHPEALLVTCWQNLMRAHPLPFALAGHVHTTPEAVEGGIGIDITTWLLAQGLPRDSFMDIPFTHNLMMPWVLRECDVALFPNRCEGGTNLVAMEAMACGVPTYVAYNTGQKDIVDLMGARAFRQQGIVKGDASIRDMTDWGETSVDEVIAALEEVYQDRTQARQQGAEHAEALRAWDWSSLNERLLTKIYG